MGISQRWPFSPAQIDVLESRSDLWGGGGFLKDRSPTSGILTAVRGVKIGGPRKAALTVRTAEPLTPTFVRDLEIIAPNFTRRLSGVTSTLERVVPILARHAENCCIGSWIGAVDAANELSRFAGALANAGLRRISDLACAPQYRDAGRNCVAGRARFSSKARVYFGVATTSYPLDPLVDRPHGCADRHIE